jgi:hypothetical protein
VLAAACVVAGCLDGQCDAAIALDIAHLLIAEQVGADDVLAVQADDDRGDLRAAISVQRRQVRQLRVRLEQRADGWW